jgi:hypothetical protein
MRKYQIIRKTRDKGARWSFVAHGATYSKDEAAETCRRIANNSGDSTRLLAVQE